ncbi:MAG: integral membrane protein [Bacteroidetes bacterium OLB12]|nr:MAG: integral membrane protein [Bacteroidetes bacterium OLB12]HNR73911.1 sulfite exporter TauE/SafE family protein [Cyclobacteriaceae bacterium]HNU42241.1 sulfite exporter TauE/SafE family protein [Cyclobacteriaceae bacterium]
MWTAIVLGLAGSLHCAGMCSPLAMAVTARKPFMWHKIIYNTGRVLTYGLLGLLAAAFGSLFSLTAYQHVLSFLMGAIFLLMGFGAISGVNIPVFTAAVNKLTGKLKQLFGFWLQKKQAGAVFVMGMLNGLLPCGLTYLALTSCFILPTATEGFLFMILFGLGTWPVMVGFSWLMGLGFKSITRYYNRIATISFMLVGIWLMARVFIHHPAAHLNESAAETLAGEVICK